MTAACVVVLVSVHEMAKLAPKQAKFVECYLLALNATQAAISAGYAQNSAHVTGSKLLKVPKVAAAVQAAMQERAGRTSITADRVLQGLAQIAFADISKAYDEAGALKPLADMPPEVRAALQGVTIAKTGEKVGVFADRRGSLESLGKHLGLFRDKLEVSGKDGEALSITIDMGAK